MNPDAVKTIDTHELKKRRDQDPGLCLIDVREKNEWQAMHIPGARHIPKGDLTARIIAEVSDRNHPVYLHCQGGVRSLHSAQELSKLGYREVYSLSGGIAEWAMYGYPVERQHL